MLSFLQPRHHLLHPLLVHVGVDLGRGQVDVPQQRLNVHPFRAGVQEMSGVGVAQLVRADLLLDPGLLQHPPPVGAGGLRGHRLAGRACE